MKKQKVNEIKRMICLEGIITLSNKKYPELKKFNSKEKIAVYLEEAASLDMQIDIFDIDTSVRGLFLCSDGLTNMLNEEQIEKVLNSNLPIEEAVVKLIKKANSRGGTDNISVAYLKKESGEQ